MHDTEATEVVPKEVLLFIKDEVQRLQHENDLWLVTAKELMPYVQHRHFCPVTPCRCGMIDVLRKLKQQFEAVK